MAIPGESRFTLPRGVGGWGAEPHSLVREGDPADHVHALGQLNSSRLAQEWSNGSAANAPSFADPRLDGRPARTPCARRCLHPDNFSERPSSYFQASACATSDAVRMAFVRWGTVSQDSMRVTPAARTRPSAPGAKI